MQTKAEKLLFRLYISFCLIIPLIATLNPLILSITPVQSFQHSTLRNILTICPLRIPWTVSLQILCRIQERSTKAYCTTMYKVRVLLYFKVMIHPKARTSNIKYLTYLSPISHSGPFKCQSKLISSPFGLLEFCLDDFRICQLCDEFFLRRQLRCNNRISITDALPM